MKVEVNGDNDVMVVIISKTAPLCYLADAVQWECEDLLS